MATTTTNYDFKKPAGTDFYNIEDQNDNWDIADGAIKGVDNDEKAHEDKDVDSSAGAHGLRFYDEKLEAYNTETHQWDEIQTGGGGSTINVTTEETVFYGLTVTLTDGTTTLTGVFDNNGLCQFRGVTMTGTLTASVTYEGDAFTNTVNVTFYKTYEVVLSIGETFTLNITTTETTLYGKAITVTNGTKTKTGTFSNAGTATINIHFSGSVTISSTDGTETATKTITVTSGTASYSVALSFIHIYGVAWDGSATQAWTRTDDAEEFTDPVPAVNNGNGSSPFDNLFPWSEMTIVEDAEAGTCVKIPKFWFRLTMTTGMILKLQIADGPASGFSVCPACADRGDGNGERDYILVGRYHCATSTCKSTTGVKPMASKTRAEFRTAIHRLGSNVWQYDISTHITIWMLYLVEFANWDSQKTIGYGCGNDSATENMGYTDAMTYHTGTSQANRTTYGVGTQYRYIEGLWDNVLDWCDGIYFSGSNIYLIKNPSNFSDSSGGVLTQTRATTGGYIKSMQTSPTSDKWFLYPNNCQGATEDTYVGDQCGYNVSGVVLCVGGSNGQVRSYGLFYLCGNYAASYNNVSNGSRLIKLP